ncbi:MAG: PIN domain-containing protein [Thermoleophilia bacterium]
MSVRLLLDTNAYVAFKGGDPNTIDVLRMAAEIRLNTVVVGELLAGFSSGSREAVNRRELAEFLDSPRVDVLDLTQETAAFYATVFALLKRRGRPIPTNDLWIAGTALEHGLALVTFDGHFREIEGLRLVTRPEDLLP